MNWTTGRSGLLVSRFQRVVGVLAASSLIAGCGTGFQVGVEGDHVAFRALFLSPVGIPPKARVNHTAVYDPKSKRMVVFGGSGDSGALQDVWVLSNLRGIDGSAGWIRLAPLGTAPESREAHSSVYDPASNRMIVFGGRDSSGGNVFNDAWLLLGANGKGRTPTWTTLSPSGVRPPARAGHTAVYDSNSNRMIIFGGTDLRGHRFNDLWVLTNCNGLGGEPRWIPVEPDGAEPPDLQKHTAVYDERSNRMIVFGGFSAARDRVSDVWVLANANAVTGTPNWIRLSPEGTPPVPRERHTAIYDGDTNRMVVFGGFDGSKSRNDVWVLIHATGLGGTPRWVTLTVIGATPEGRGAHSAVYIPSANLMLVFGGKARLGGGTFADAWALTHANGGR